jgi:hypothetical protein
VTLAWVFFRAASIEDAMLYLEGMTNDTFVFHKDVLSIQIFLFISLMIFVEWFGRGGKYAMERIDKVPRVIRYSFYSMLILLISIFGGKTQEFIYFQF